MRRRTALALALLASTLLVGSALSSPTSSAQGQEVAFLNITKVVDGDGPTGGYVIEFSCVDTGGGGGGAPEGGGGNGGSLAFDAAGPGAPETQQIVLSDAAICTVTETDSNGADTVTYECSYVPGDLPTSPDGAFAEGDGPVGGCIDDQSGVIARPDDELNITVTNTFDADVLPEEEPPAVNPDVVAASPSFTG
jgi:hypothetical protein